MELDCIDAADDWILNILMTPISKHSHVDRLGIQGTAVVWRELDRLLEDGTGDRRQEIVERKSQKWWAAFVPVFIVFSGVVKYSKIASLSMVTSLLHS